MIVHAIDIHSEEIDNDTVGIVFKYIDGSDEGKN